MGDLFSLILLIAICAGLFYWWRSTQSASLNSSSSDANASNTQMVEDIKSTQTSRVVDAVEILDELSALSANHRQYCELVGTTQASSGVIAPYSQREVAFYDVRCYRIDYKNGQEVETLVAHEKSFDPFYFTDASCDTPVYVDLTSFGNNVILVNSTNHIEGPNSDFANAISSKIKSSGTGSASLAIVGGLREKLGNVLSNLGGAFAPEMSFGLTPAYAGAGAGSLGNVSFAKLNVRQGGAGSPRGKMGGGSNSSAPRSSGGRRPSRPVYGGYGNLGSFLGGGLFGGGLTYGGGMYGGYRRYDLGDAMLDIGLGALLGSLSRPTTVVTTNSNKTTTPQSTFRGYRLVENVVPLNSPVYCIGEIYRNGTDVYMGRSTSSDYSTSFFATRPEAEVIAQLGG